MAPEKTPFEILGVSPGAQESEIRAAWRRLARRLHPDAGGTNEEMAALNTALARALLAVSSDSETVAHTETSRNTRTQTHTHRTTTRRVVNDRSCFTIDVLPVESFELMQIVAATLGSIIDEDCPYVIEFSLDNLDGARPMTNWCRCELMPEAGGTTVHLSVGQTGSTESGELDDVRDSIINCLNSLFE